MSAYPKPANPSTHRLSANSSMGLVLTTSSQNPHLGSHNDFFAQLITFHIVYELLMDVFPCLLPCLELSSSPFHVVISSTFGYQIIHYFLRILLRITWTGQISVLLLFIILCICSWHLSHGNLLSVV